MTSILYDIQELFLDISNFPSNLNITKLFSFRKNVKPTDGKNVSDLIIRKSSILNIIKKYYIPN